MRNFVGILILVLVVIFMLEFYHRNNENNFRTDIEDLESRIILKDRMIDSLRAVIRKGRTSLESNRILGKPVNTDAVINDMDEYLKSMRNAKGYENRGKYITAKELYISADKYKLELTKVFSKDSIITLDYRGKNKIDHNFLFNKKNWKMKTHYYSSVYPQDKPEEWLTEDKVLKAVESIDPDKEYRITFKVLETMSIHYSGSVTYFTLHLKYLDVKEL